jgi:hypothetical protein
MKAPSFYPAGLGNGELRIGYKPPIFRYLRGYMKKGRFMIGWKHRYRSLNDAWRFIRQTQGRKK